MQAALDLDHPEASWESVVAGIRSSASSGARLIVAPELATVGYVFASRSEALDRAEDLAGPRIAELIDLSDELGVVLVAGWCELSDATAYNSAVVLDQGRVAGTYRKTHLWGVEAEAFTPGDQPGLVVDTSVGRVGVLICYDVEFPESVRSVRQRGAQILAAPVNWPLLPRPAGERAIEVTKAQAAAAAYRLPIAIADRCGQERGVDWIGGSCLIGQDGYLLAGPVTQVGEVAAEAVVIADVELTGPTSLGDHNDVLADRRPELYAEHEALAQRPDPGQ